MFTRETFEALDDTELSDVRGLINDVYQKRLETTQAEEEILRNLQILQNHAGTTVINGRPWAQPTGAHDVYPLGSTVVHEEHLWESDHPFNMWEPGTGDLWTDRGEASTPDPLPLDVYPTWGPGIAVKVGDLYAHQGGILYTAIQAHTTEPGWAPDLVPALWKKVD